MYLSEGHIYSVTLIISLELVDCSIYAVIQTGICNVI